MEKRRLLIVDSEADFIAMARKALTACHEVRVASSRKEGLEKVKRSRPDVVIIGFLEPRGDSFKFYQELKKNVATRNIPLLLVDVRLEEHSKKGWRVDKVMQMDIEGYLIRPVKPDELEEAVTKLLEGDTPKRMELKEVLAQMEALLNQVKKIEKELAV